MATIFMIAYNGGTSDNRVMKQARALVSAGHRVHLFCGLIESRPSVEIFEDVYVHRFPVFATQNIDLKLFDNWLSDCLVNSGGELSYAVAAHLDLQARKLFLREQISDLNEIKSLLIGRTIEKSYKQLTGVRQILGRIGYLGSRLSSSLNPASLQKAWIKTVKLRAKTSAVLKAANSCRDEVAEWWFRARYGLLALNLDKVTFSLASLPERPDIIHAHDLYTLPTAIMLARRLGGKVIYDAHEIEVERFPPLSVLRRSFIDRLERDCLEHVDALITVSDGCGAFYEQRFSKRKPVIILNSPDQLEAKSYSGPDIRTLAGLNSQTPLVVFTGAVGKSDRGVDKVVAAIARLPAYHLAILGPRHKINDPWLMEHIVANGVSDRVHLLDPVGVRQVVNVIRTADVAVCSHQDFTLNYRHALPNKLFEAAMAKVPICVSDLPDMRSFVEALGIGLHMDQADPDSIAAALEAVVTHRERYLGNSDCDELIAAKYGWPKQAQTLLELYQSLLGADKGKNYKLGTREHSLPA